MTHKALVVDDDPNVREAVADILDSLGHQYDMATCQDEARRLLAENGYSYVLLDLELPVRTGRGFPRIQNGENLLAEIRRHNGAEEMPVIVMTGHGLECPDLAVRVMKNGAVDFVKKPFPSTGNTLDKAIREALARNGSNAGKGGGKCKEHASTPVAFSGGEMVFFSQRVELYDVRISAGRRKNVMRRILDALREKRPNGKYVAYSGEELGEKVGCRGDQNRMAGAIRDLRQSITQILRDEAGVECGPQDVVQSGGPGYRLNEWIIVGDGDAKRPGALLRGNSLANDAVGCDSESADDDDLAMRRREWILAELRKGCQLRAPAIVAGLGCSATTAKRDLEALRAAGRVVFVGPPRSGFYRMRE